MSSQPVSTAITLSDLLPNSYVLVYAIPLLLVSIVVTFAGAFLTLDRTRSFTPIEQPASRSKGPVWRLEGGVGGLLAGWLCGVHFTTYLALLILNRSHLKLEAIQFLVIWVLCSALLAAIGGRWRIAASVFYAIVGGGSLTALMNIVFLPQTLLPRLIIYAVFTALLMFCTLLPIPPLRHSSLRTCSALTGSAGIVITIALFSTIPSWSSPWLTLAIQDYVGYRNAKEKGLSAALSVLTILGAAVDWLLKLKLGENPDKEWDAYLARYSREFPFASERAGKFEPLQSIWTRMFKGHHTGNEDHEILFPPDSQLLPTHKVDGFSEKKFSATPPPAFRPYLPSRKRSMLTKSRSPALATLPDISSDSSDDEHGLKPKPPTFRPWLPKRLSTGNSVTTLVASLAENTRLTPPAKLGTTGVEDYSDVEQDVTAAKVEDRSSPDWKPAFIRKHEEEVRRSASLKSQKEPKDAPKPTVATDHVNKNGNSDLTDPPRLTESPIPLSRQNTERSNGSSPASSTHLSASPKRQPSLTRITTTPAPLPMPIPMGSVPATPSLIRAYDRIQRAQQEATQKNSPSGTPLGSPPTRRGTRTSTGGLDEAFWLNVRAKAGGTRGTP